MRAMRFLLLLPVLFGAAVLAQAAEESYPVHEDSKAQEGVPKGEMIKASYTAKENSVFPGTEREYQVYIPAGLDKTKPAPFMVFQDGVIYNAPVVFDNLIAKKEIPAMIGIFIKPGVVPAANPDALPRFNRSYEYDSVTDTYSRFLIDEFLPAITQKHGITLSADPNDAGISGNSSGGICAFMVAWHRSDRFRRVFTGVGTYVGIHGADQLPVLVRKMEPKPIKVYLQSGENDNNLYCGDWWMANQMMERSLTWAGYDVAHTWGTGGHNGKQATAIFPDVMRWLWKGYPEAKIKANPEGKSKWLGYQVLKEGSEWKQIPVPASNFALGHIASNAQGELFYGGAIVDDQKAVFKLDLANNVTQLPGAWVRVGAIAAAPDGLLRVSYVTQAQNAQEREHMVSLNAEGKETATALIIEKAFGDDYPRPWDVAVTHDGWSFFSDEAYEQLSWFSPQGTMQSMRIPYTLQVKPDAVCLSPDQSLLYVTGSHADDSILSFQVHKEQPILRNPQRYYRLERGLNLRESTHPQGLCVDTEGRLYVSTSVGVQVCDQAGRVNFIIPTPGFSHDICFGGKDLSELFIACGDEIYKRQTKVHGVVSGQQPPIKPAPPKL